MVTSWLCATAARARLPPRRAAMRRYRACRWEFFLRRAPKAAVPRAALSQRSPGRVAAVLALPAVLLLPGQTPAQEARCAALGKRAISTPISAMITWAAGVDTVDGVQQLDLGPVGGQLGVDAGVQLAYHGADRVDVGQDHPGEEGVVVAEASGQG